MIWPGSAGRGLAWLGLAWLGLVWFVCLLFFVCLVGSLAGWLVGWLVCFVLVGFCSALLCFVSLRFRTRGFALFCCLSFCVDLFGVI